MGMKTVTPQAIIKKNFLKKLVKSKYILSIRNLPMVQPMVPKRRSSNLAKKSMKFREALCVSLIRPNSESYDGGSAVYEKQTNIEIEIFVKKLNKIVLGQTQLKSSV